MITNLKNELVDALQNKFAELLTYEKDISSEKSKIPIIKKFLALFTVTSKNEKKKRGIRYVMKFANQ